MQKPAITFLYCFWTFSYFVDVNHSIDLDFLKNRILKLINFENNAINIFISFNIFN